MFTILSTKTLRSYILNTSQKQLVRNHVHDLSRSLSSSTFDNQQSLSRSHNLYKSRNLSTFSSAQQGSSSPSGNSSNSRKGWIAGLLISAIMLPFSKDKINSFFEFKNEVEIVVEDAEIIAEVVEKVSEEVAEIADVLTNKLPEGGKLKNAVDFVENVSKEIVKDANIAENIIHKIEDFEKEVDALTPPATGQGNAKIDDRGARRAKF